MKTKRRHELQTNELAGWVGQTWQGLQRYGNQMLWGAVGVAALVLLAVWVSRSWRGRSADQSTRLTAVLAPQAIFGLDDDRQHLQQYESLADDYRTTLTGKWARLMAADTRRRQAIDLFTADRLEAELTLRKAVKDYERLTAEPAGVEWLDEAALLGHAQALEALGELQEAKEVYAKLLGRHAPQQIEVEKDLGDAERADYYLIRRYATEIPAGDVLDGMEAGLVEREAEKGAWEKLTRYSDVKAGDVLRVQLDGPYTLEAKRRLGALSEKKTGEFYDWLAKAEMPPPRRGLAPLEGDEPGGASGPGDEAGIVPEFEAEPTKEAGTSTAPSLETAPDPSSPPSEKPQP